MNTKFFSQISKTIIAVFAFAALASLAMAFPAQAKGTPPSQEEIIPGKLCMKYCLRVSDINLTKGGDTTRTGVISVVTVKETPSKGPAVGASVYAVWTFPDGTQVKAVGTTNQKGQAVFRVDEKPGVYTFTIITVNKNVGKIRFTFDRLNSVLFKSVE